MNRDAWAVACQAGLAAERRLADESLAASERLLGAAMADPTVAMHDRFNRWLTFRLKDGMVQTISDLQGASSPTPDRQTSAMTFSDIAEPPALTAASRGN
jgi:uncharacterized membrane protein YccC